MIILDGSMGNELLKRSNKPTGGLWSAQFLIDNPNLVKEVHQEYVNAGAKVITTNTYSTIPSYLCKFNKTHLMSELVEKAGFLAKEVSDENDRDILVAGALPPLDESYRPDLVPDKKTSIPVYEALITILNPYVDLFLCETVSSIAETSNVLEAIKSKASPEKKIWLSWTLIEDDSSRLRSKESIEDAFNFAEEYNPDAYLFNCTNPEAITHGLESLKKLTDKPLGAYPNVFDVPHGWTLDNDVDVQLKDMSIEKFVNYKNTWESLGAEIVGGCCGIGPEYIEAISR